MGEVYPELRDRQELIAATAALEEEQFIATLDRALSELERALTALSQADERVLPGEVAFDLKSTHGLPLEVTRDICVERGVTVDEAGFHAAEERHRKISQGRLSEASYAAGAEHYAELLRRLQDRSLLPETGVIYDPYGPLKRATYLVGIVRQGELVGSAATGEEVELILPETSFYAEAGGQVGDTGVIEGQGWRAEVYDIRRPISALVAHQARIVAGAASVGAAVQAAVDADRRWAIMRNHTATHLLHESLRQHLGRHVHQAGSLVSPDRLRFDFTYEAALEPKQIRAITDTVNQAILAGYQLDIEHKPYRQALAEGATALFGEKYGDVVRTISLGDCDVFCSYELCGGTHVQNTSRSDPS